MPNPGMNKAIKYTQQLINFIPRKNLCAKPYAVVSLASCNQREHYFRGFFFKSQ